MLMTEDQLKRIFTNPFYCININQDNCIKHQTLVSKETWVEAFCVMIRKKDMTLEQALNYLLENLEQGMD